MSTTDERGPSVSDAVDAALAFLAPVCLHPEAEAAMEAVRDLGALVEAERDHAIRQFMEARDSWVKFLRAPTDRESDEGSKALDRLFGTEGGK